jgi:hypothetical protein
LLSSHINLDSRFQRKWGKVRFSGTMRLKKEKTCEKREKEKNPVISLIPGQVGKK